MINSSKIYLVDDDDAVRISLTRSLEHQGYDVEAFCSGVDFLEAISSRDYGCVILDVAMPVLNGLEVQSELMEIGCRIPIIFITGHGDVPTSVRALKSGAIEFLEKPYPLDVLLERIEEALKIDDLRYEQDLKQYAIRVKYESLTKREKEVMAGLCSGVADKSNKEVAKDLNISHRTVEEYRARIFNKMQASSITHLVEMAKLCEIDRD